MPMKIDELRREISEFLGFHISPPPVSFLASDATTENGYQRIRIQYTGEEGDLIPAFLLLPEGKGPFPGLLIHHQHHGQRHLGKSEVCGLAGDPLQAFGPALASRGLVVLAPDSICFEDRRLNRTGIEPHEADTDQHYNEMCHRLLRGDTLMRKILSDSALGISLLRSHPLVDPERVGMLGHSYGGNTVLFHGALDERIHFACASGAACTYRYKIKHQLGIEMAEVIPGFASRFDIPDLVACFAPRHLLLVSATEDPHSLDADEIFMTARQTCASMNVPDRLEQKRYTGRHSLTQERYDDIVSWITSHAGS